MADWREIERYAKGTSTRTTIRLRRQHLFTAGGGQSGCGKLCKSLCGLHKFDSQLSIAETRSKLCGNCVKALVAQG